MSAGLSSRFNILQQSPHDFHISETPAQLEVTAVQWVPSRYNIRAVTEDGRLVLWNSFTGTMSVFPASQRPALEGLLGQRGFTATNRGIVKYLRDRGFLVKAGTDEFRRIRLGFGQQQYRNDVLQLILLASEDCNFRCEYCYEDFARGTMQPWVRDAIKKLVQRKVEGGLKNLSIAWFGGEPLYGLAAIEDLAPFFCQIAEESSLRFSSNMTTNGYLLTPTLAQQLLSWRINSFQITLDGAPEDHDRSRPTRDGQGTFATIFENLLSMRNLVQDFSVNVRINFDRSNHPRIKTFLDLFESEFRHDSRFRLRFRSVGQWGGPNDDLLQVCGDDEAEKVQLEMKVEARRRGLRLSDDIRQVQGLGAQVCYAARPYNFIVGASGKLMKCTIDLDKQDRNIVGHLTENGELNLDQDKFALWTEPAFEDDSKCKKCVVLPACQGVFCPLIRIETGNSPCSPLRMNAKKEIRFAVEDLGSRSRRIAIKQGQVHRPGTTT